jgi:hypothetical protein
MSLIDDIVKISKELEQYQPSITRIIVVRYGVPVAKAYRWPKHGGILWINELLYAKIPHVAISPSDTPGELPRSTLYDIPVEYYMPERHGDLYLEFMQDLAASMLAGRI